MSLRLASALILAVALCPLHAAAQTLSESDAVAPAHVSYVEGSATLERDGKPETAPLNMPLLSGDRLKTQNGRVEVLFGDGSALHLDAQTTIDLQSDDLLRLIDGRVRLAIAGRSDARSALVVYRVDSPAGSVRVTQPGEYRVAILRRGEETQLELAVLRGSGEIFTDEGTTAVRAGERAYASAGLAPSYAYSYNSANWDAFDRWSESRRDTRLGVSTQYLPSEVRTYASTFDEDGDWRYQQAYGYVWYPRVAVGWRPYYYGRWAAYPRYGWTWIGADRFAWPTHHYGRWGFSAGAWFWIPGARWAPAHVSWAYAPGYVSWCPLGFDNRPVIAVNYFNVGPGYYSSWHAWTAVGYAHFGRGYVHHRAVHWNTVNRGHHPSFRVAQTAPAYRDIAVPRANPIRTVGSRTVAAEAPSFRRLPPSGGRTEAAGNTAPSSAGSAFSGARTPRYVNRGDAIVRSQTERPSAPAPRAPGVGVPSTVEGRTMPAGPARRADAPDTPSAPAVTERTRIGRETSGLGYSPRVPYERGSATPRADAPAYQPPARTYERYGGERAVPRATPSEPVAPSRESAAPPAPDPGPRGGFRPRGYEARPGPAGGAVDRQPSAPRAGGGANSAPAPSAPTGSGARTPRGRGGA